jgi:predicted RNase H-like nuclease
VSQPPTDPGSASRGGLRKGPELPYRLLAAVEPRPDVWLVATGRLQGTSLFPDRVELIESIRDVLDARPAYDVVALHAPVGLPAAPAPSGRTCDREAMDLLGARLSGRIVPAPGRAVLKASTYEEARSLNDGLSRAQWRLLPRFAEVDAEIEPYHQRQVYEVNPELAFFQMNDDRPFRHTKRTAAGQRERRAALQRRLPGIERLLDVQLNGIQPHHLLDVAADLVTARRIAGRSVARLPESPEWDERGLRMEIVR